MVGSKRYVKYASDRTSNATYPCYDNHTYTFFCFRSILGVSDCCFRTRAGRVDRAAVCGIGSHGGVHRHVALHGRRTLRTRGESPESLVYYPDYLIPFKPALNSALRQTLRWYRTVAGSR